MVTTCRVAAERSASDARTRLFTGLADQHGTVHACAVPIFFRLTPRRINSGASLVRTEDCSMTSRDQRAAKIAALNDAFRQNRGGSGRQVMTAGIHAEGPEFVMKALAAVATFDAFTADNDSYARNHRKILLTLGENGACAMLTISDPVLAIITACLHTSSRAHDSCN